MLRPIFILSGVPGFGGVGFASVRETKDFIELVRWGKPKKEYYLASQRHILKLHSRLYQRRGFNIGIKWISDVFSNRQIQKHEFITDPCTHKFKVVTPEINWQEPFTGSAIQSRKIIMNPYVRKMRKVMPEIDWLDIDVGPKDKERLEQALQKCRQIQYRYESKIQEQNSV